MQFFCCGLEPGWWLVCVVFFLAFFFFVGFWFVVFGSLFVVGFDCFGYELCDELWGCVWVFPGVGVDFK